MTGPAAHAKLSPSASARWISCPASIRLEAALPVGSDEDSPYAREGTIAHGLGELEAGLYFGLIDKRAYNKGMAAWRKEFNAQRYPAGTLEDMQGHIRGYVELLKERLKRRPNSRLLLEQRMDTGVPTCWGTSDAVIYSPTHIEIVDLKYGAGVRVDADENSQLRLYACGALDTYGDLLGDVDTVFATVYQPRLDHVDTEELPAEELRAWRTKEVIPKAEEALGDNASFGPSEKACRWCPVAGTCIVRMESSLREDFGSPVQVIATKAAIPVAPELMTPEQVGQVLHRIPAIKAWCLAVETQALQMAYDHEEHIPGWKVVRSGGKRYITDDTAAIQTLIDAGFKAEQVANFKAKGIGELEKLVGKKEFPVVLGDLIGKTTGKESLVPEDDPRPSITPGGEAATEFAMEDLL